MNDILDNNLKFRIRDIDQSEKLQRILIAEGKAWGSTHHPEGLFFGYGPDLNTLNQAGIFVNNSFGRGSLSQCMDIEYFENSLYLDIDTDEFISQYSTGTYIIPEQPQYKLKLNNWIPCEGDDPKLCQDTTVEVKYRNGTFDNPSKYKQHIWKLKQKLILDPWDIVSYRIIKI